MFCDELKLKLIAGRGGDGCVSFRREKYIPKGGPDGGDGGYGGNIIIRVNENLNTLSHLTANKTYKADHGVHGKGKNMHGKNAPDLILEVPTGTIVFDIEKINQLADLNKAGEQIVIARGGKGGLGNARFVTSTHQVPRFAENGEPGEELEIILELKLVADIGIIGLPSAGKSTLISVISNARPKIAAYHFTTLTPNLGVVSMRQFDSKSNDSFVVADIPGLIEGASQGKGLGHQFLKHISRTSTLVHLIDCSQENITKDYKTILQELKKFDKTIVEKEEIIVLNKIDLLDEKTLQKKVNSLKKSTKASQIWLISALTREGLKPLIFELYKMVLKANQKIKKSQLKKPAKVIPVLRPHLEKVKYQIDQIKTQKKHRIFCISGSRIEQLVIMTDTHNLEGLERIYQYLEKVGIKRAVEKQGARLGDTLRIKEKNIPYRP